MREADVESALKLQLISTTFLVVPVVVYLAHALLPDKFELPSVVSGTIKASSTGAAICVSVGALGGLLIGLVTEYYTSHSYEPVRECAHVCKQGAAVNLIYGLALGYRSAIVPVYTLAAIVYFAFSLADLYGVALAALGMLSTLATGLTIDGYGPVTDNAGGIAEMAQLPAACREKTDCLDACVFPASLSRHRRAMTYRYARRPGLDAVDASARHLDAVAATSCRRRASTLAVDGPHRLDVVAAVPPPSRERMRDVDAPPREIENKKNNAGPATRPPRSGRASPSALPR